MYCNMTTGKFYSSANIIISTAVPSVHNETGFAALLLGSTLGYRVYYHDKNQSVNQLDYTNSNGWSWGGFVSQDSTSSSAIHAAFSDKNNISVVTPRDSENFEVSRFNADNTWHICTWHLRPVFLHTELPEAPYSPLILTRLSFSNRSRSTERNLSNLEHLPVRYFSQLQHPDQLHHGCLG